jgi:amidase
VTNPSTNALCTLAVEEARAAAAAADHRLRGGHSVRALEGVPFTVKDVIPARGVRTTYGSPIFRDLITNEDAIAVERLRRAGAIFVGKSNTPEFAHGPYCNTTNAIFGTTRNPWDVNRTAGASSGGAAAAIASGMAPLGLGTDWGGSARGPAAFCGVVGMRPSPGRVPVYPHETGSNYAWDFPIEHVHAPMARTVRDVGLMLNVLAGPDERAPSSLPLEGHNYTNAAFGTTSLRGSRLAYTTDFNGLVPVDPEVAQATRNAVEVFQSLGCEVTLASPDFRTLKSVLSTARGFGLVLRYSEYYAKYRSSMSDGLAELVGQALNMSVSTVAEGERLRTALWHEVRGFMSEFDYLVTPTWGVCAFRIDVPFTSEIGGIHVHNFFDWILFTAAISALGLPAISVPCGLGSTGLPIGFQIAGHRLCDHRVLEAAAAYEARRGPFGWPPPVEAQVVRPMHPQFESAPAWTPFMTTRLE